LTLKSIKSKMSLIAKPIIQQVILAGYAADITLGNMSG
jgi:hypothetical protein